MARVILIGIALFAGDFQTASVEAHPGGLNKQGCHTNRKTGDYHCHRNKRATRPVEQAQSINGNVYYSSCAAARADGKRNIKRGQPGYRPALDRDNDGVACES